jgi:hypothetical protein
MAKLEKLARINERTGLITAEARDYLVGYARDELPRLGRPHYPWLQHRWKQAEDRALAIAPGGPAPILDRQWARPVVIQRPG